MKTKTISKKTVIIILCVVLAAAAIVAALLYFKAAEQRALKEQEEKAFAARIDDELAAMVKAEFGGLDISASAGSFTVTSLISGNTYDVNIEPAVNAPLELTEMFNSFHFGRTPKEVSILVTHKGEQVFNGSSKAFRKSFFPLDGETYSFSVTAETENAAYVGQAVYMFDAVYNIVPRFYLSSESVYQGSTLVVCGENLPEGMDISVSVPFSFTPKVVRNDTLMYSIIPFNYKREAGEYAVSISYGDGETLSLPYTVLAMEFPEEYTEQEITVSDETAAATINNSSAYSEYNNIMADLSKVSDDEVYWDSWFAFPCEGSVTSDYGFTRYINGKAGSTHAGIDFACDEGTPVYASNDGRVIFAGELKMSGNTVVIEHGNGVQSKYLHMSAIKVSEGDMVSLGQEIGAVGMTGLATGPHLHFEIDISGFCVSPWPLLDGTADLFKIEDFQPS